MKNSIFEITEKTRNRTFKATVEDVNVGDSVMRTTLTVEKTTLESGEVKTVKTRKIVEYEPGDEIPDQERAIAAYFAQVSAPVQTGETRPPDDKLQKVKLSTDEFANMMVEKLNSALGASLAADPLADIVEDAPAAEEPSVVLLVDSADARMLAELEAVEPDHVPETDEQDLRSKILAESAYEEPAAPVAEEHSAPVTAPVASPVTAPVASPVTAPVASPVTAPVASPVTAPPAEPEKKKKPFRLADIPDPKQAAYDEAVKELRRQREARAAALEDEAAKRAGEVLNSAFATPQAEPPAAVKRAPTDAEVMDGLEPLLIRN